ncbi:hypothetical protein [Rhizobium sp. BK538]|uniref:hypothetical protein n=1 Tax=Rhizobium sp. BK538 TaxID=2586984 RepID=UPI001612D616|nr:hypothetical protein [Rhizobium sp. BK538]MBB4169011.1 hypothetical protein [Rhizobium sp. BK538]
MKISELSSTHDVRSLKGSARPTRLVAPANSNIPSPAPAHEPEHQSTGSASSDDLEPSVITSVAVVVLSTVFIILAMTVIFDPDRSGELGDMISSLQFRLTM